MSELAREGFLDVALRERHADLQEELAVTAQHRDLAPGQPGTEHEAVEAVVLGVAAPHLEEGVLERGPGCGDVEFARRLDLEVLQEGDAVVDPRSEAHTSELQSLMRISYA